MPILPDLHLPRQYYVPEINKQNLGLRRAGAPSRVLHRIRFRVYLGKNTRVKSLVGAYDPRVQKLRIRYNSTP